jgi:hypothetical protein
MSNLEPFKLKFPIYGGVGGHQGFYFISTPLNYNLQHNYEIVDLSKWCVDSVVGVYIQSYVNYKEEKRLYHSPTNSSHLKYTYDTKTSKLQIFWGNYSPRNDDELNIKFYSISQQRDKILNELFNEEENKDGIT